MTQPAQVNAQAPLTTLENHWAKGQCQSRYFRTLATKFLFSGGASFSLGPNILLTRYDTTRPDKCPHPLTTLGNHWAKGQRQIRYFRALSTELWLPRASFSTGPNISLTYYDAPLPYKCPHPSDKARNLLGEGQRQN